MMQEPDAPFARVANNYRVIFVDGDGVLHPSGGAPGEVLPFAFAPVLSALLEAWPEVFIVVHSSWRELFSAEEIREFLGPLGPRFAGVVPLGKKEVAICQYLSACPSIDDFLILDDEAEEFSTQLAEKLVLCDPLLGVTDQGIQATISNWLLRRR